METHMDESRKEIPMARGLLDYFPDALAAVARLSFLANDKHNPGEPMHWAKEKSNDHADCILRHMVDRGKWIVGEYKRPVRHSTAVAWRALAMLQMEIEGGRVTPPNVVKLRPDTPSREHTPLCDIDTISCGWPYCVDQEGGCESLHGPCMVPVTRRSL